MAPCTLKELRKQLGLSQQQLAETLGTSHSTICRIENGRQPMSGPMRKLLAQMYDAPDPQAEDRA